MSGARIVKITVVVAGKPIREGASAYVLNNTGGFFASVHLYPADEGVTWIRDWHDDDSEPVAALLAARRLMSPPITFSGVVTGRWSSHGASSSDDDPHVAVARRTFPSSRFHPIPTKHVARRR